MSDNEEADVYPCRCGEHLLTETQRGQECPRRHYSLRLHGGAVLPGLTYLVGEEGPELIVPKDGRTVIPKADPDTA